MSGKNRVKSIKFLCIFNHRVSVIMLIFSQEVIQSHEGIGLVLAI